MSFVKCYDVAEMVIDEATKQFGSRFKVDEKRQQGLKEYCDMVDVVEDRFGGVSYEVEVDNQKTEIMVSLVCSEFEIYTSFDDFYNLMSKSKKVSFKKYDEELIRIDFVFNGIWVRTF